MAVDAHIGLRQRQRLARRDAELPLDQIEPGDRLGHRMLDLQPRVHFHEPEAVRPQALRAVGDELDRAGALIADRARGLGRGAAHRVAHRRRHAGRRRFLDHLLVAALQRAVALVEMDDVAVAVGEHLHLDVARRGDVFLDQHARIAERRLRLARRAFQRGVELGVLVDAAHALAAAARDRLDQHRIADLVGLLLEELRVLQFAVIAGHDRHAGLLHQRLGPVLQPHGADRGRRRSDEHDAGRRAGFGELRILRQEAVARMDAVCALRARATVDQLLDRRDSSRAPPAARSDAPRRRRAHAARRRRPPNRPRSTRRPSRFAVRAMRTAISPRLAIRTEVNMGQVLAQGRTERHRRRSDLSSGGHGYCLAAGLSDIGGGAAVLRGRARRRRVRLVADAGAELVGGGAVAEPPACAGGGGAAAGGGSAFMMLTGGIDCADGNVHVRTRRRRRAGAGCSRPAAACASASSPHSARP